MELKALGSRRPLGAVRLPREQTCKPLRRKRRKARAQQQLTMKIGKNRNGTASGMKVMPDGKAQIGKKLTKDKQHRQFKHHENREMEPLAQPFSNRPQCQH